MNIIYLNKKNPKNMKNKFLPILVFFVALVAVSTMSSCSDDETFTDPTISLSETAVTASPGDNVSISITFAADPEAASLVITKQWDGNAEDTQTITTFDSESYTYSYTVLDADADHSNVINFLLTDSRGTTTEAELVIIVVLTPRQLLVKYNWNLNEEVRIKTGSNDINDVYTDDVYQFNADGTYQKSIGAKVDDFNDIWYNYCYYDFNETTMRLLMSRTGAFGGEVTDTLNMIVIDEEKLYADVVYYGLDVFDETYDPAENFEKRFVAVAKTSSFDPYQAGADDDSTGPANMCADVTFDNN